jgi:hypothetical protein
VAEAHAIESNRVENSSASATARLYLLLYLRHFVCVQTRMRCLRRSSRSGQTMINDDTSCGGCGAEKIRCTHIEGLKGSLRLQLTEDGCARLNALHVIAGSLILFGVISLQHRANADPLPQLQWTGHERLACASLVIFTDMPVPRFSTHVLQDLGSSHTCGFKPLNPICH